MQRGGSGAASTSSQSTSTTHPSRGRSGSAAGTTKAAVPCLSCATTAPNHHRVEGNGGNALQPAGNNSAPLRRKDDGSRRCAHAGKRHSPCPQSRDPDKICRSFFVTRNALSVFRVDELVRQSTSHSPVPSGPAHHPPPLIPTHHGADFRARLLCCILALRRAVAEGPRKEY